MNVAAYLLLGLCLLALLHTYVLYPVWVRWRASGRGDNPRRYVPGEEGWPQVSVLMSLYNEEKVIAQKMRALMALQYPPHLLHFYIGSDCSSDGTDAIMADFATQDARIHFFPFPMRRGKPPVINELAAQALLEVPAGQDHVFLLTDASVMPEPEVLQHLVRHFKNPDIGVVDAHMRSAGLRREGISRSEERYLSGEVLLKHAEGVLWGKMIGPFGGCYALRSDLFEPVPPNSLVDDFYLVFRVLEQGYSAINDLEAVCYEGATHYIRDEFRRKKRIAAGNFQNLQRFRRWVWRPFSTLGFVFLSHKVLRWFGGFFMLGALLAAAWLATDNQFFRYVFLWCCTGLVSIVVVNAVLEKLKIHVAPVKHLHYFLAMNIALIAGFVKWRRGIRENTWERTERY